MAHKPNRYLLVGRTVWYPGHMAKGKKQLDDLAKKLDLIIEVRDARAPHLSASPQISQLQSAIKVVTVLAKADLSNAAVTKEWIKFYGDQDMMVLAVDTRKVLPHSVMEKILSLKPAYRELRLAVMGIPNVGKSQLLNNLVGRRAAKVGGIPGITKGLSWFKGKGFWAADSPGILDPKADARVHRLLTWLALTPAGVIGSYPDLAGECIEWLIKNDKWRQIAAKWDIVSEQNATAIDILEIIGKRLGKLAAGGAVDIEAASKAFLDAFSSGKIGAVSLESPNNYLS